MTIKAVEWALKREGISSTAKLVLVMLCDCINAKDEFAFPKQERIAQVIGRSDRQVRRHLEALVENGLVLIVPGKGSGRGRGRAATRYRIACDHVTGEDRPFDMAACGTVAGGHIGPSVNDTAGHLCPPATVTGGHLRQLQADVGVRAYKEEPEEEPELPLSEREEPNKPMSVSAKPKPAKLDGRRAIELFDETAARVGWCVTKGAPSHARKQAIAARLREHGMEGWVEQLAAAEEMPFLRGENDRGWRMGIDYFARPSGWSKISEGGFKRVPRAASESVNGADLREADRHRAAHSYHAATGKWPRGYTPPQQAASLS